MKVAYLAAVLQSVGLATMVRIPVVDAKEVLTAVEIAPQEYIVARLELPEFNKKSGLPRTTSPAPDNLPIVAVNAPLLLRSEYNTRNESLETFSTSISMYPVGKVLVKTSPELTTQVAPKPTDAKKTLMH